MIELPINTGRVRVNPAYVSAIFQKEGSHQTSVIMHGGDEVYIVSMSIEEVEKKLAAEYTPIGYLSEVIETLTNVIRNR